MKKNLPIIAIIILLVIFLFVIPILSVGLAVKEVEEKASRSYSYAGTEYSYFAPSRHQETSENARNVYNDIVAGISKADWSVVVDPILKVAFNPVEAARQFEKTYGISISEIIPDNTKIVHEN